MGEWRNAGKTVIYVELLSEQDCTFIEKNEKLILLDEQFVEVLELVPENKLVELKDSDELSHSPFLEHNGKLYGFTHKFRIKPDYNHLIKFLASICK